MPRNSRSQQPPKQYDDQPTRPSLSVEERMEIVRLIDQARKEGLDVSVSYIMSAPTVDAARFKLETIRSNRHRRVVVAVGY